MLVPFLIMVREGLETAPIVGIGTVLAGSLGHNDAPTAGGVFVPLACPVPVLVLFPAAARAVPGPPQPDDSCKLTRIAACLH